MVLEKVNRNSFFLLLGVLNLKNYYVYVCKNGDEILYIGCGYGNRLNHCTSGRSHVVGLNELVFKHGKECLVVYKIKKGLTKEQALKLEGDLILKLHPKLNVDRKYRNTTNTEKQSKKMLLSLIDKRCSKLTSEKRSHIIYVLSSFIDLFGLKNIQKGTLLKAEDIENCVRCGSIIYMLNNTLISPILSEIFNFNLKNGELYISVKE